jgi:hypothetical protein
MLGWLTENFDVKVVFVIRHPGAVVSSKMRRGGIDWDFNGSIQQARLHGYLADRQLLADSRCRHPEFLQERQTSVAGHTLIWCLENALPIAEAEEMGCCVVFYENLILRPQREFDRIVQFLGLEKSPSSRVFREPSQEASKEMAAAKLDPKQLDRWSGTFDEKQLSEMDSVLKAFGISIYSAYEPLPLTGSERSRSVTKGFSRSKAKRGDE